MAQTHNTEWSGFPMAKKQNGSWSVLYILKQDKSSDFGSLIFLDCTKQSFKTSFSPTHPPNPALQ
jgi:hypothetical protein